MQRDTTHGVDDDVDAATVSKSARLGDEIMRDVIDAFVHAEFFEPFELLLVRCGGEDARARALSHLDRRDTNTSRTRVDKRRLTRGEPSEFEKTIIRRAKGHRHARCIFQRDVVGDLPREGFARDPQFGVRSVDARRDHSIAERETQ